MAKTINNQTQIFPRNRIDGDLFLLDKTGKYYLVSVKKVKKGFFSSDKYEIKLTADRKLEFDSEKEATKYAENLLEGLKKILNGETT
jgi:hypothetical protein